VRAVWGSGQTGRTGGKFRFVRSFMYCMVHRMVLSLTNEGKEYV